MDTLAARMPWSFFFFCVGKQHSSRMWRNFHAWNKFCGKRVSFLARFVTKWELPSNEIKPFKFCELPIMENQNELWSKYIYIMIGLITNVNALERTVKQQLWNRDVTAMKTMNKWATKKNTTFKGKKTQKQKK
jgi:hypothetical protein